jgi:hypothetical protein
VQSDGTVAVSALAVALAVAFDIATLVPHTIVRVTSVDGRQATVPLQVPKRYVWADPKLVRELLASEVSIASPATAGDFAPNGVSANDIKEVVVIRGPEYRWWADSQLTGPVAAIVASLWIGLFLVRRGAVAAIGRQRSDALAGDSPDPGYKKIGGAGRVARRRGRAPIA